MYTFSMIILMMITVREPFEIDWNVFQISTDPEFSIIGFGDWCIVEEDASRN